MRVMVMIKANEASEAGQLPNTEVIASMHAYNESLMKAGILLDGDGLKPSSQGRRISNRGGKPHVTDGPFAETKELIAGFWVWEVSSMEEASATTCSKPRASTRLIPRFTSCSPEPTKGSDKRSWPSASANSARS